MAGLGAWAVACACQGCGSGSGSAGETTGGSAVAGSSSAGDTAQTAGGATAGSAAAGANSAGSTGRGGEAQAGGGVLGAAGTIRGGGTAAGTTSSGGAAQSTGGSSAGATLGGAPTGGTAAGNSAAGGFATGGAAEAGAGGNAAQGGEGGATDFASTAAALAQAIDAYDTTVDFTLMLANAHGTFFNHSHGVSTADTPYESASTSKWVTSAVLLHLVDQLVQAAAPLTLASKPQGVLTSWTSDQTDLRSHITLEMLLSFRSGLEPIDGSDAACISLPSVSMATCVGIIYNNAATSTLIPGEDFVYGSQHMQVAGLMAMRQQGVSTWGEIFDAFKSDTGLFPESVYDLPSTGNPRLAGGMHWTATEYLAFLGKLFDGTLLSTESAQGMFSDHTPGGAVNIAYSPVVDGLNEMWHYGLGNWLECRSTSWRPACATARRYSSPGAYGAYPFIDFGVGFYGILARQGPLGTFPDGMRVYRDLEPLINALVAAAP